MGQIDSGMITAATPVAVRHYRLFCPACGVRQEDDGLILDCSENHEPALLQTEYTDRCFRPRTGLNGLFRYQDWLPIIRASESVAGAAVYQSRKLAKVLELPNLWIAFNGYWPERNARLETATFKDLEANTVLGRMPESDVILTLASSGNTGAAFAWACSQRQMPCLIIVPANGLRRFRFSTPLHPCVNLVVIDDGDYPDAMDLAASVSRRAPFQAEGGIKNVGRRDGLATVLFAAFEEMECLPSHYFQAVGSGTGAIAVLEAAKRICRASDAIALPRLMMCQNAPFTPIYEAWQLNRRSLVGGPTARFRDAAHRVYADELTNWAPPYEIRGGVFDSLADSLGGVLIADNFSVARAVNMFSELEGIDIEPAAGVALACLCDAVAQGSVGREASVLLNITGGGRLRRAQDHPLIQAQPQLRLTTESIASEEAIHRISELFASSASTPRSWQGAEVSVTDRKAQ
jgi:cysteate synthase